MVNFVDGERYCACAPGNTETLPVPAAAVSVDEEVAVVPAAPPRTGRRVRRRFRLVDHTKADQAARTKARPAREQVVGHDPRAEQVGPWALLGSLAGWFRRLS